MPEIPKILQEVNNLPRIRKFNIITNIEFAKPYESELMYVYYKYSKNTNLHHAFDTERSDFEEQVAEWIVDTGICSTFHHDGSTEYETLSEESRKLLEVAKIQLEVKKAIKNRLTEKIEHLKSDLNDLIDVAVDEAFKKGAQNGK